MVRRRGNRRRGAGRNANNPLPVATMPINLRPTYVIPLLINVSSAGANPIPLPSALATGDRPWRLTSCAVTAGSGATGTFFIEMRGGVIGGGSAGVTEVTARTRTMLVAAGTQEVKMRNGSRVQHCSTGAVGNVITFFITGTVNIVGVAYISVIGDYP